MQNKTEYRKLSDLKKLPNNPRTIKTDSFEKLCESLKNSPDYFEARPLILSDRTGELIVIAGNQRYEAANANGSKEAPTYLLSGLTEEKEREIIIRDNVNNGTWDWDVLANEWNAEDLESWGLDVPTMDALNGEYSTKVESPIYTPKTEKPNPSDLIDVSKRDELIKEIESSNIPEADKEILRMAAQRHVVFHYGMIAEYYAHADKDVQDLMENSAMVIIDYDKAIEKGFVKLTQTFAELMETDE